MARRLWAFVLALGVASGSVASILCQVTCTVHSKHVTVSHESHHSHASAPRLFGETLRSATHTCDHQFDDTLAVQQTHQPLTAPAVIVLQAFLWPSDGDVALVSRSIFIDKSPPGLLALTAQLRV